MKRLSTLALFLLCWNVGADAQYSLTVESTPATTMAGQTVYRFYVDMQDPGDELLSVYGNSQSNLIVNAPDGIYNSGFNASWSAEGINPAFLPVFPELADDTYATIGLDGPASSSGLGPSAQDPGLVEDPAEPIQPFFLDDGATTLSSTGSIGSSWYVTIGAENGRPQDGDLRVLIMQVTTAGDISGQINFDLYPSWLQGQSSPRFSVAFNGAGTFDAACVSNCPGCASELACNYDPEADAQTLYVCVYPGDACDDGDATTVNDLFGDDCSCGGTPKEGCTFLIACNYDPTAIVEDGSCIFECPGCTDEAACNYDDGALQDDGSCLYPEDFGWCDCDSNIFDECGVCGGGGLAEGACDCEGNVLDECGVCGGDGLVEGACDCEGNVLDVVGVCGGDCDSEDIDIDGICDNVDDCVGVYDACGVCNGPGAIYECGCFDVPSGDCDCEGNVLDECGVCGGSGFIPGTCDCDGLVPIDQCGICGGDGTSYGRSWWCTYEYACNYDVEATISDYESCEFGTCGGCLDINACNYNPTVGFDDGSCHFNCYGCTDSAALNFNPVATIDSGPCLYCDPGTFILTVEMSDSGGDGWNGAQYGIFNDGGSVYQGSLDSAFTGDLATGRDALCLSPGCYTFQVTAGDFPDEISVSLSDEFGTEYGTIGAPAIEGIDYLTFGQCSSFPQPGGHVTFQVDMNQYDETYTYSGVFINGSFNGWCGDCLPMSDPDGDGVFEATVDLPGDTIEYKFTVDGWNDQEELAPGTSCTSTIDGYTNRTYAVTGDVVLDLVCWNSCDLCQGAEEVYGCTDSAACNYDWTASVDDGSCDFEACSGCTDEMACNYDVDAVLDDGSCDYSCPTVFNVDMSCAPVFTDLFVTGPWCGWCANDLYNTMTDDDGDGIYSVTIPDLTGTVEYKYAINGFEDQEDLINDMIDGAMCAPVTNYATYANRQIEAGSVANDYYGTCDGTCNDSLAVMVTFQVDMNLYDGAHDYTSVSVAGNFDGWCYECNPMEDLDGDGVWGATLWLSPGTIEYRFWIPGVPDAEEFSGPLIDGCTVDTEAWVNRGLTFDTDTVLNPVCWESCDRCPFWGCTDENACNFEPTATNNDDSCVYNGASCNDGNGLTVNDTIDANCNCTGTQQGGQGLFWYNDISNCDDWVFGNGSGEMGEPWEGLDINFDCGSGGPAGPFNIWAGGSGDGSAAPAINSTSGGQFLMLDSDLFGADGAYGVENAWAQTAAPINCSTNSNVAIAFETRYRCWDNGSSDGSEKCFVEISRDGVTWPALSSNYVYGWEAEGLVEYGNEMVQCRFEVFPESETGYETENPSLIELNISEAAGGQSEVWVRFRWVGTWGYSWEIDDVAVAPIDDNDLRIQGQVSYTDFPQSGIYENGSWALGQMPEDGFVAGAGPPILVF